MGDKPVGTERAGRRNSATELARMEAEITQLQRIEM
jgi:hypothetical protein